MPILGPAKESYRNKFVMPFSIHASYIWNCLQDLEERPRLLKEAASCEDITLYESNTNPDDIRFYAVDKQEFDMFTITYILAYLSHDLSMLSAKKGTSQIIEFYISNIPTNIIQFSSIHSVKDMGIYKKTIKRVRGMTHRSYPLFHINEERKNKETQVESYHYEPNILLPPRQDFEICFKNLNKYIKEHKEYCLKHEVPMGKLTLALSIIGTYWCDILKEAKNHAAKK